jgi:type I restriction enzyme, S subunit
MTGSATDIRKNWRLIKLKYAARLVSSRADSRPDGMPYVGMENIESHTGRLINAQRQDDEQPPDGISTVNLFEEGDVLFGKLRPYLAKGWLCSFSGASTTEALVLRPGPDIDPRYLLHTILSTDFIREVDTTTFGSKMPRADWADIGNLAIHLPPREKQEEIVRYLQSSTATIDALVAAKQHLMELLVEKRHTLITQAVTHGVNPEAARHDSGLIWLGQFPADWRVLRAKVLFREIDERSETGEEVLLSLRMTKGLVPHNDVSEKVITPADLIGYKKAWPRQIVINRMRAASGLIAVVPQEGLVSPDYAVFEPVGGVNPEFFTYLFQTPLLQAVFRSESKGLGTGQSGFLRLYSENFLAIHLPVPPLEEQLEILEWIRGEAQKIDAFAMATEKTITLLQERRSALISAAVTGQIDLDT